MATLMKAICFNETGAANDVLSIEELPLPSPPDHNEVIVKITQVPVNPSDILFIKGKYRIKPLFPQIAGLEGAGKVVQTGRNTKVKTGALVAFFSKNTWAEYVAVNENDIIVLPDNFPIEKAAQFALNPYTAYGLIEQANLQEDEWLLLTAANSSIATIIRRIAQLYGINVISAVRSTEHAKVLADLGMIVVDLSHEDLEEKVSEITNGNGVNCVFDAVGGNLATKCLRSLAINGKMIIYGSLDLGEVLYRNGLIQYKDLSVEAFGIRKYLNSKTHSERNHIADKMVEIIGNPEFNMSVADTFTPNDFINRLKKNQYKSEGKILIKFD